MAQRVVGVALALGLALGAADASAVDFPLLRVGTCRRDITPVSPLLADAYTQAFGAPAAVNHTEPVWLAGFGNGRAALGYHDRLWARGVVIDRLGKRVAIVALDVVGYFENEIETIRSMVASRAAVDFVIVTSTHNHQGPDTLGLWGPTELESGIDYGYLDFVNAAVADCIEEAAAHLQLARVRYSRTTSHATSLGTDAEDDGFGVSDGKVLAGDALLAPETDGRIVDPRLSVVQFTHLLLPFRVIATLVNFASHPESLGSNNPLVTSDFPHSARERVEKLFGGTAIWISGALGVLQGPLDIDVLDPKTGVAAPRRTFRFAEVHGEQLAERAASSVRRFALGSFQPELAFASAAPVAVRLDNPFFRLFVAAGVLNVRRSLFTDGEPDPAIGFPYSPPFDPIPQALGEDIHTSVAALRLGEGWFAVVPTELDPQIGERYRARMSAGDGRRHTFILGLGNDHIGYQVPFEKWDGSCHTCAPFIIAGVAGLCPVQPIDCNTVFSNNVGQEVDPSVTNALEPLVDSLQ